MNRLLVTSNYSLLVIVLSVFLNVEELFKLLQDKKKIQTQASKSNKKESLNFTSALLPPLKIQSQMPLINQGLV